MVEIAYMMVELRKYKRGNKYPAAGAVMTLINSNMKGTAYERIEDERNILWDSLQTPGQHLVILNVYFHTTQVFHHNPFDSLQSWIITFKK